MIVITAYSMRCAGISQPKRLAVVSDFHNGDPDLVASALEGEMPDLVLVPGDFLHEPGKTERGFAMLAVCASRYPTFCSVGNHEVRCDLPDLAERVAGTGAVLLDNAYVQYGELCIGGLSSGFTRGMKQRRTHPTPSPDRRFLSEFARAQGCRILLCHHPEYYDPYIREKEIPLILSGHAHGGQWEIQGRGVFAPGQGLFPRYTAGLYDGRLLVSRGLAPGKLLLPRIHNPQEILVIDLWQSE